MEDHYNQNEFPTNSSNLPSSYINYINHDPLLECKASITPKMVRAPKRAATGTCQFCKDTQISAANWCRHLRRKHPEVLGLAPSNSSYSANKSEAVNTTQEGCANKPKRKSEIWKWLQYFPNDKCVECHKEMRNLSPWNAKRHLLKKHPEVLDRFGLVEDNGLNNTAHPSTYEQLLALTEESCSSPSPLENGFHFLNGVQSNDQQQANLLASSWEFAKLDRYKAETNKIRLECEKVQCEKNLLEAELRLKTIEVKLAEKKLGDETYQTVIAEAETRHRLAEARLKELQVREMEIKLDK